MTLAHYDALTARAFDRHDANFEVGNADSRTAITQHNQRMDQLSHAVAAVGRVLFHLGVWCAGMTALWLSASP